MMKWSGLMCCFALLATTATPARAQQPVYESTPVTLNATIAAIDKAARTVTLKTPTGTTQVQASEQMQGFNGLKVGDQVSATYFEAVVLRAVKPGAAPSATAPTTMIQRKDRAPGSERRREQNFVVTIEEINLKAPSVRVKGPQGTRTFPLTDPIQFQDLKAGDTIELTYYESLLVEVARPKKN